MDYIMVTLQSGNSSIDLKVPTFVKIEELLTMLGEALNMNIGNQNRLQAEPLGRILDNDRTLQEENVTQGSLLTLI